MANKFGRSVPAGDFNPKGLLPEGLLPVARPSGEAYAEASVELKRVASAFGQLANHASAAEGERAGKRAGLDPAYRPSGQTNIYATARDDAATKVYAVGLDTKMRADMLAVYDANKDDPQKLAAGFDTLRSEYLSQHVFPDIQGPFDTAFARLRLPLERRAQAASDIALKRTADTSGSEQIAARRDVLTQIADAAGLDGDANTAVAGEFQSFRGLVDAAVQSGELDKSVGARLVQETAASTMASALRGAYERLPDTQARKTFVDGLDDTIGSMSAALGGGADVAAALTRDFKARFNAEIDGAFAAEARAEVQTRIAREADGTRLLRDGKLTQDWIEQNADLLSGGAYRRLSNAIKPLPAAFDPAAYGDLLARAVDDQRSVLGDAAEAMAKGKIDRRAFDRLYDLSGRLDEDAAQRPWALDLKRDVVTQLKPSALQPAEHARQQLDGVFEFQDWLDRNPEATPADAHDAAASIVERARGQAVRNERAVLALPRFAPVARDAMSVESLVAAGQRLRDERYSGRLTDDELVADVEIMRRWQDLLQRETVKRGR